jgi:hypothetical protein
MKYTHTYIHIYIHQYIYMWIYISILLYFPIYIFLDIVYYIIILCYKWAYLMDFLHNKWEGTQDFWVLGYTGERENLPGVQFCP